MTTFDDNAPENTGDTRPSIADPGVLSFILADLSMSLLNELKAKDADSVVTEEDMNGTWQDFASGLTAILVGQTDLFTVPEHLSPEKLGARFRKALRDELVAEDPAYADFFESDEGSVFVAIATFLRAFVNEYAKNEDTPVETFWKRLNDEDFFDDWADWLLGDLPVTPTHLNDMADRLMGAAGDAS